VSVREIADTVRSLIGPVPVEHVPARAADYPGLTISNSLAKELLGWSPVTSFPEGVRRYLDWLKSLPSSRPRRPSRPRPPSREGRWMARALLLSGSLGAGHDVVAEACAASLRGHGWSTQTLDAMRLLGRVGATGGEAVFRGMLAVPGLFDAFHFAALRTGSPLALLADAAAGRRLVPRLRAYLDTSPADLVISVFATGAAAVSRLAERYPDVSHVVFCTDVTPHRLWVHPHVDLYLVTSAVAEAAVRRFQPEARVLVIPPAVRPGFYRPPTQARARAQLGLPPAERCVLLMSGAWGLGPVA